MAFILQVEGARGCRSTSLLRYIIKASCCIREEEREGIDVVFVG